MNKIELVVENNRFELSNVLISSKVYDDENRDIFTNSYSVTFNISFSNKQAQKLFKYSSNLKSKFEQATFENCELYVGGDLLSNVVKFQVLELDMVNEVFVCYLILNEFNNILIIKGGQNIDTISINDLNLTSSLNLYSGSTQSYNPIPNTLNAKFILNNNYNYSGIDNYLTINSENEISEEDLVFNFNIAGLLRIFLSGFVNSSLSFTSLDYDYFFKIDKTELNYNSIYNKNANVGITSSTVYNNFKYDSVDVANNKFDHKNFRTEADTFTRLDFNTVAEDDYDKYRYSYFKNDSYNKIFYLQYVSGLINVPTFVLAKETLKYVNLPIVNDSNVDNLLPDKFNYIINNNSIQDSIYYNNKNHNSLIIPSYNNYLINFNYNLNIDNQLVRALKPSNQYDDAEDLYLSQEVYNNMAVFALGFENSTNNDKIENIFNYIYNSYINIDDYISTGETYETLILDDYLQASELVGMDNLVFIKVIYDTSSTSSTKFLIRKYVTRKLYLFNNIDSINKIDDITLDLSITLIDRNDDLKITRSNIKLINGRVDFDILYEKDNEVKELKPLFVYYDDSGYIVPSSNLNGWRIGSTFDIGQTAVFNKKYIISLNNNSNIPSFSAYCYYLNGQVYDKILYKIPNNLLPDLKLKELFKQLCIIKGCYLYYQKDYIDLKPFSFTYNLKNYKNLNVNKIYDYNFEFKYWVTGVDESNFYSSENTLEKETIKYTTYFKHTNLQNKIYRDANEIDDFNTLAFGSSERYNKNRRSYNEDYDITIDGVRDFYDGFYLYRLQTPYLSLDDDFNNNDGKSVKFVNKLNNVTDEKIFNPKISFGGLLEQSAIYKQANYNIFFGNQFKNKFEATINIPYFEWKESKNMPIKIFDNGIEYIIFEIADYNLATGDCIILGIKS